MLHGAVDEIKPTLPVPPVRRLPEKRRKSPLEREEPNDRQPARPPFRPIKDDADGEDDDAGSLIDEYV